MQTVWMCPHCRERLLVNENVLSCSNGHSFDMAREGYVNLLVGRQKSGIKGDTPEMLAARRRFLDGGWYDGLRSRLAELVGHYGPRTVAEVGCGEGFYIGGVKAVSQDIRACGTDIAKEGVRMAARRYPEVSFAVADTNSLLPLPDKSADIILNIFAPRNVGEFDRVLCKDGRLIVVAPTARHLAELREISPLLAIQADKRRILEDGLAPRFRLTSVEELEISLRLSGQDVSDLVGMTPNAWFLTEAQKQLLAEQGLTRVTASFEILIFG